MQINTPFIIVNVRSAGDTSTMTIWYAPELKFRASWRRTHRGAGRWRRSLKMRTVMNKPAPHEHIAGQQSGHCLGLAGVQVTRSRVYSLYGSTRLARNE